MKALVIGGTGPTGPRVVQGLLDRGYETTIYHRGFHETDALPEVQHHLHGNADDREALEKEKAEKKERKFLGWFRRKKNA